MKLINIFVVVVIVIDIDNNIVLPQVPINVIQWHSYVFGFTFQLTFVFSFFFCLILAKNEPKNLFFQRFMIKQSEQILL